AWSTARTPRCTRPSSRVATGSPPSPCPGHAPSAWRSRPPPRLRTPPRAGRRRTSSPRRVRRSPLSPQATSPDLSGPVRPLLPATWLSARRRTILVLHRSDDGVTAAAASRYPVGQFLPAWSPDEDPDAPPEVAQWAAVRRMVEQADPRRIGIDVSRTFAHA